MAAEEPVEFTRGSLGAADTRGLSLVERHVHRSSVIDTKTGQSANDPIRTSYGGSVGMAQTRTVAAIEQRIADWTQLPPQLQEPMQVRCLCCCVCVVVAPRRHQSGAAAPF